VAARTRGAAPPYDESLEDWILLPQGDSYIAGRLDVSEASIRAEMARGEVPRATIRHIYHFSSALALVPNAKGGNGGMVFIRSTSRIERMLELDPFEVLEMDVILVGVIFCSRCTLESRRTLCRRLADADRRNGLTAGLAETS
jgi:hypothetical protein